MQDVYHTFSERFMKAQLVLNEPEPPLDMAAFSAPPALAAGTQNGAAPTKRYNAFGILEDIPPEELAAPAKSDEPKPRDRKDRKKR